MNFVATLFVEDGWIKLRSPYDRKRTPDFIAKLKNSIPSGMRKWDPEEKVWKVDPSYDDILLKLCEKWFEEVNVIEMQPTIAALPAGSASAYHDLLSLADGNTIKKVYRLIASSLHPDKGGDVRKMTEANAAWEQIKKERGL